jgi:hypothetical protein
MERRPEMLKGWREEQFWRRGERVGPRLERRQNHPDDGKEIDKSNQRGCKRAAESGRRVDGAVIVLHGG